MYLRAILHDFGFPPAGATQLFEDSRAVHCMAENPVNRKASRHIDTRKHFIGELVENVISARVFTAGLFLHGTEDFRQSDLSARVFTAGRSDCRKSSVPCKNSPAVKTAALIIKQLPGHGSVYESVPRGIALETE